MLRLLIVEDEKGARETLSNLIDWSAQGVELIGACSDGIQAYDMIVDEYPDIVLTDIRMPGLDGLGLIERVRHMDCDIRFIILSGYGEFEYAKTAMKYGVHHYLLKPCDEKQIFEAIEALHLEITRQRELSRMQRESAPLSEAMRSAIQKQFTIEAITGTEDFAGLLERYSNLLVFPQGTYDLYCFSLPDEEHLCEFVEWIAGGNHLFHIDFCFNFLYVKGTVFLLICVNDQSDMAGFERLIGEFCPQNGKESAVWRKSPHDTVQAMLEELLTQLQGYHRIILINNDGSQHEIDNHVSAIRNIMPTIQLLSKAESDDDVVSLLHDFFTRIDDADIARMLAMQLVTQYANQAGLLQAVDNAGFYSSLYDCGDVTCMLALTSELLLHIFEMHKRQNTNYRDYVSQAMVYVQKHLNDPQLSLKWLAENHLFVNVDYFGRQFLKQTGEKFSAYLGRMRMEKAKQLILQYDSDRIYMVANQVGCGRNPQYFSQLFKKWTGITPKQYREKHSQGVKINL